MPSEPVLIEPVCANSFERITYDNLGGKQQENYNFAKVSALFANFGFSTIRLTDDWHGVDFIAHNPKGQTLFVQLKGRFTIHKKYVGKQIYVCFPWTTKGHSQRTWFLYPHDCPALLSHASTPIPPLCRRYSTSSRFNCGPSAGL